ncbi:MAG: hypothetical protein MJZ21_04220 [archaeon]|nr:hypothetical protein [archaeon]
MNPFHLSGKSAEDVAVDNCGFIRRNGRMVRLKDRFEPYLGIMAGAMLFISGAYQFFNNHSYDFFSPNATLLMRLIPIIAGIVIMSMGRRPLIIAIGVYSTAVGLQRLVNAVSILSSKQTMMAGYNTSVLTILGTFTLILAINCLYSGHRFYRNDPRRSLGLKATGFFFSAEYTLLLYRETIYGTNYQEFIFDNSDIFIYLIQFVILLFLLETPAFRKRERMERSTRDLDIARTAHTFDEDVGIGQKQAMILSVMFSDRSAWTPVSEGPVESEYRFRVRNSYSRTSVILQKWRDSDYIYMTVSDYAEESILLAQRFTFCSAGFIEENGVNILALCSPDGSVLRLKIRDASDECIPEEKLEVLNCHY